MVKTYYNPTVLTEARKQKGFTKREVSRRINRPWQAVYRSEVGTETSPNTLRALCELYEIPLSRVLDDDPALTS